MKRAEPGWLVLALAGIAAGVGSFLPFYTFGGGIDLTVWNRSLFPTATLISLLLFAVGLEALYVLLMGYEPRSPFLNFTWSQARLAGSAFAIVLALSFLVQGRAGGSLGSGYIILSLSTLATFAGAVLTRRAELARGHEEIVKTAHPWRAAVLRWRRELTAKAQAYANGGSQGAPSVQPVSDAPNTQKASDGEGGKAPDEKPEEPIPEPTPVPRLSAVHTEPEPDTEEKADEKSDEKADKTEEKPAPSARKRAKRAAKKTEPQKAQDSGDEVSPATDGEAVAEVKTEAKAEPPAEAEAKADAEATAELEATTELDAKAEAEAEPEDEREQPAAPG
jgi:hypothetical protein